MGVGGTDGRREGDSDLVMELADRADALAQGWQ